jgi:hypothetical protein
MQTFSQYAATRPLRSSSSGTPIGAGTAVAESIQTFAGVDVVTGMPVIVYTMSGQPPSIPDVISESIPVVLETGIQDQTGFVVVSSAPGYLPLRLGLSQVRLEWLTRVSAKALSDAHDGGLVHGDFNPNHFFVQGDHLLLEGWGLNWQNTQPDFTPPEGQGTAAADVFAWARTMQAFGKGDSRKLLDGEMGRLIGHCLNPKPQERPTALELVIALEQVIGKKALKPEVKTVHLDQQGDPEIKSETFEPQATQTKPENTLPVVSEILETSSVQAPEPLKLEPIQTFDPSPIDEGVKIIAVAKAPETIQILEAQAPVPEPLNPATPLENSALATPSETLEPESLTQVQEHDLREPENLAADEPDIVPSVRPEHEPVALPTTDGNVEPGVVMYKDGQSQSQTIRVGFDDDDSWRSVKPYTRPKTNPLILPMALVTIVLLVILGIVVLTRKPPQSATGNSIQTPSISNSSQNSIVNFIVKSSFNQTARLTVISAPSNANLVPGTLLATIPGPVLFPYPGAYKVRVTMPNFAPGDVTVNVPQDKEIVIQLRQP